MGFLFFTVFFGLILDSILTLASQIIALFATALSMGAVFGLLFGLTDVENDDVHHTNLMRNAIFSIPLGVLLGGVFGALNQFWRSGKQGYDEIKNDNDDDSKY